MIDQNFKVPVTKILDISPHPNPKVHSLQIAKVYDFDVVISSKSGYEKGMTVVYFPVNSVLPGELEAFLFPPDSKIKLEKSRIKAIKIHQFISQGMIVPFEKINEFLRTAGPSIVPCAENLDLQEILKVVRHRQRPVKKAGPPGEPKLRTKKHENEYFKEYKGCTNLKWVPNIFSENDEVWISEKIHGSCWRAAYMPKSPTPWSGLSFKDKIKKIFQFWKWGKKEEEFEFCYGSNHVQRQNKRNTSTWHGSDKFYQMIEKYDLENKLKNYPGFELFGEIYGPTIQKGYHYGLKNDEIDLVLYDVLYQTKNSSDWLVPSSAEQLAKELGVKFVPILYRGKWDKDLAISLATGDSVFCKEQKCIEGVVVKNTDISSLERKKIKIINPEYTLKESTEETTENDDDDFEDNTESGLEDGKL